MSEKPPQQPSAPKRVGQSTWPLASALLLLFLALVVIGWCMSGRRLGALWLQVWGKYSDNREDLVPLVTLAAGIVAAWVALGQLQTARRQASIAAERHQKQTEADLQRRIIESFTKAVEQLGSQHLQVRIGGIYALERISRESDEDYWTVMETLTAFVRERARWKEPGPTDAISAEQRHEVPTDVAAVIAVISRRSPQNRKQEQHEGWHLDLTSTDLRGADLEGVHLERTFLRGAHLEGAFLRKVHFEGANLSEAHLEGAFLMRAHLEGANLSEAHLEGAYLSGAHLKGTYLGLAHLEGTFLSAAHLEGADLRGAHLEGTFLTGAHLEEAFLREAHLEGANLTDSSGLTQDQLNEAYGDAETVLPEGVKRPDHWEKLA